MSPSIALSNVVLAILLSTGPMVEGLTFGSSAQILVFASPVATASESAASTSSDSPGLGPVAVTGPGSVAEIRAELAAERESLEALLRELIGREALYDELERVQTGRSVARATVEEHKDLQREALKDVSKPYFPPHEEPDRVFDFQYRIWRSIRTLESLQETVEEERAVLARITSRVDAENATVSALDTELAGPLAEQRRSHLAGLDELEASLSRQALALAEAEQTQRDRHRFIESRQVIWRELESIERQRALERARAEHERAVVEARLLDAAFEGQRSGVKLLREHHRARMQTVSEYIALLDALDRDLAALDDGDPLGAAEVRAVRATLGDEASVFADVASVLSVESAAAADIQAAMAEHERLLDRRSAELDEQEARLTKLTKTSVKARQLATVDRLHDDVRREAAIVADLRELVDTQLATSARLYEVGRGDEDGRVTAYLGVRDRILDVLVTGVELQVDYYEREADQVRSKERAVVRLSYARGVQDLWERLPELNETMRRERLETQVLAERFEIQQEVVGWLTVARVEAASTYRAEADLLERVRVDLGRVETAGVSAGVTDSTWDESLILIPPAPKANASPDRPSTTTPDPTPNGTENASEPQTRRVDERVLTARTVILAETGWGRPRGPGSDDPTRGLALVAALLSVPLGALVWLTARSVGS